LPDDGVYHVAFRSSPNHTFLDRSPDGSVGWWLGGVFAAGVSGVDTAVHTYALRTNGNNLHELLIDGVVVKTLTTTGLLQPTNQMYIGSTNGKVHHLNGSTQSFATYDKALTDAEIQRL